MLKFMHCFGSSSCLITVAVHYLVTLFRPELIFYMPTLISYDVPLSFSRQMMFVELSKFTPNEAICLAKSFNQESILNVFNRLVLGCCRGFNTYD